MKFTSNSTCSSFLFQYWCRHY